MIDDPTGAGGPYRVIDVHQHIGSSDLASGYDERLRLLDAYGIDHAVLLPPSGAFGSGLVDTAAVNRRTAEAVSRHPDRFVCGVAHLELAAGEEACLVELDRAVDGLGLRGAVWHHRFQGASIDHPAMPALLDRCARWGVPALVHTIAGSSLEATWRLDRLLEQCPDTTVVALDAFSGVDRAEEIILLARRHRNLHCDLGAMISVAGWLIKKFLVEIGPDRLMLGTDLYLAPRTWYSPAPLLEVVNLDVESMVKRRILADNAVSVFGL